MSRGPLNSDDINSVSYPGAEDGLSLIQMSGGTQVIASISLIRLRRLAQAVVSGKAVDGSPPTYVKMRLGASTFGAASTSAGLLLKTKVFPSPAACVATPGAASSGALVKVGASTSTQATTSASAFIYLKRSAQAACAASASSSSLKRAYRGATSGATATSSVSSILKVRRGASTTSLCVGLASARWGFRLSAASSGIATTSAGIRIGVRRGASSLARAVSSAPTVRANLLSSLAPIAPAAKVSAIPRLRYRPSASSVAVASTQAAATWKFRLGASVVASVVYAVAGVDLSITRPAPIERRMTLPIQNRRMEVTE